MSKKGDFVNMNRARPWHPQRPHNALAELPPALDPETRQVLKRCVTARVALADLNRAAELLPNPRMLEISLPLLEAQASSEIEETATWTTAKIEAIRRLQDETWRFVEARAPRTLGRPLIDLAFDHPYCRIADVVEAGIAERQTASRYLHALVELGVLRARRLGREKLFFHPRLLGLLTEEPNVFEPYP